MKKGFIYLIITIIFFSSYEVVGKTLSGVINPFQINFLRFFFGGLIILPFALHMLKSKKIILSKKDIILIAVIGIVNVVISMNFLQLGINTTKKANLSAVIFSSNPIFVSIFAAILLREKLNIRKIIGLIIGIIGVIIIFYKNLSVSIYNTKGIIFLLLSSITYGLYTTLGKKFTQKTDSIIMNSFSFLLGSIFLMPILIFNKIPVFYIPSKAMPQIIYLTVFVTGMAYITYFIALNSINTAAGSSVFFIKPVLASLFAFIFLKEVITLPFIIGTIIILFSIFLINFDNLK